MCSQPIVQAAQAVRVTRWASLSISPEIDSAPSNWPAWKFRVGSAFNRLKVRRFATVPSSRYFAVAGPKEREESSFAAAMTPAGSATGVRREPRHADCFQVLRAEDRAQSAAAGMTVVVADRGKANEVLARWADDREGPVRAKSVMECARRAGSDLPPFLGGRFEPRCAVVDEEDRWRFGAADDHQGIEAGLLPLDGEAR